MAKQDEVFGDPVEAGEAFKAAEHEGQMVAFLGAVKLEIDDQFGDGKVSVADCDLILVMNEALNEVEAAYEGWVFGAALAPEIYRNGNLIGTVTEHEFKNGRTGWNIEHADAKQRKAVNAWAKENLKRVGDKWLVLSKDEAPF